MENVRVNSFRVIGIAVRTTNKNNQSMHDLGGAWQKFYSEDLFAKIPGRTSGDVYCVYTNYKSDYTDEYIAIIGAKVNAAAHVPEGMAEVIIHEGSYRKFTAKGKMPDAVVQQWMEIWKQDKELNRAYTTDFEIYGEASQREQDAETAIFIAVK